MSQIDSSQTKVSLFANVTTCRFVFFWSVAWGIAIMALSPVVDYLTPFLNPSYANQWTPDVYWRLVLYWHGGIFIPWITALAVLVCMLFDLNKMHGFTGSLVRESVFVGGLIAPPLAGIAGIFDIYDRFALGIPLWAQIAAFLIGDEMAIALIVAMVNRGRESIHGMRRIGLNYLTTLIAVFATLISAILGHIAGWITWFGPWPSFVPQYINSTLYQSLGYYNSSAVIMFTENTVGSHSHLMLPSLMAGVVALVATYYGYGKGWSAKVNRLASVGFLVMIVGMLSALWVYIVSGVGNYSIPTLFTSANGVNGIAADDLLTGLIGLGAFFVFVSLLLASRNSVVGSKPRNKDVVYLSIIVAWILIYLVIPVTGYYIELNQTFYSAAGISFDEAYTRFHQDFGFFVLPALVTVALGLEMLGIAGKRRLYAGALLIAGELIAFVFGEMYAMVSLSSLFFYGAIAGGILMGIGALVGIAAIVREERPSKTKELVMVQK
ncbi:MAG: hypothetical protein QXX17_02150 [Conexivisphaerales archaeon]